MVFRIEFVTKKIMLIRCSWYLSVAFLVVFANPVAGVEPNNPGFWDGSTDGKASANPRFNETKNGEDSSKSLDLHYREVNKKLSQRVAFISSEISKHWSGVEISGASKWVEYGADWRSKRVVDYRANEIRVSSLDISGSQQVKAFAHNELKILLGTTILAALQRDSDLGPVTKAIADESLEKLVFSELFRSEKPSSKDIARLAQRLMKQAYVRYQGQLAALGTTEVALVSKASTYVIPLPKDRMRRKAKEYMPHVKKYADQFQIPADVMMAIMHTESHFNPLARSHIPAFGLMQIVPRTAGRDASRVLYNKQKLFTAGFLYQPENNIKVGAAYLNVLSFKYLKNIKNPLSRLYCMVAAYNTGSTNVALAFTRVPRMQKAVGVINEMGNQQVLMRLIKYLPKKETRDYVEKVLKRRDVYSRT
ncbi:MAG: transglycosylase SLT domain-containing protein [Gammaproteobacteria bacterium]|nr:transglycosylase SLT domain-containing protein [Gammaproteobacteria bacterium]